MLRRRKGVREPGTSRRTRERRSGAHRPNARDERRGALSAYGRACAARTKAPELLGRELDELAVGEARAVERVLRDARKVKLAVVQVRQARRAAANQPVQLGLRAERADDLEQRRADRAGRARARRAPHALERRDIEEHRAAKGVACEKLHHRRRGHLALEPLAEPRVGARRAWAVERRTHDPLGRGGRAVADERLAPLLSLIHI